MWLDYVKQKEVGLRELSLGRKEWEGGGGSWMYEAAKTEENTMQKHWTKENSKTKPQKLDHRVLEKLATSFRVESKSKI